MPVCFRPSVTALESRDNPATVFTASGAIAGGAPLVEVVNPGGVLLTQFQAFDPSFSGGVRVDTGELDGDPTTVEVAVAAGPNGGPRVQVYAVNITTGASTLIGDFFVFEPAYRGGVRIAVGDIDGVAGGLDQIIVSADAGGGPRVSAFRFENRTPTPLQTPLGNFFAFESTFLGGVRVAAGELDGNVADGDELAIAAGPGGGPRVRVLRGDATVVADFFAADPASTAGVNVQFVVATGLLRTDTGVDDFSQRSDRLNAPIRAALAAQAALLAAQTGTATGTGNTLAFGTSTTSPFSIGQNGGNSQFSGFNPVTGAFGTTQTGDLGTFGTGGAGTGTNTASGANLGATGTGASGTGSNGNAVTF